MSAPTISLPSGIFRCVEVDPPWQYRDRSFNGTNSTQRQRSHCPYPTMPVRDLFEMRSEIRRLLHPDGAHLFTAPRGAHSAKPAEAYDLIARNSPGPRCSLFQRTPRPGFVCWGNELISEETPLPA